MISYDYKNSFSEWANAAPIEYLDISLNEVILLNIDALGALYHIQEIDPCACEEFTRSQLISAKTNCEKLSILLERLSCRIFYTDPLFRPLDLIITSSSKAYQVARNLSLIIHSLNPICEYLCEYISIYESSLIDLQLALNNIIIATKLIEVK